MKFGFFSAQIISIDDKRFPSMCSELYSDLRYETFIFTTLYRRTLLVYFIFLVTLTPETEATSTFMVTQPLLRAWIILLC